MPELPEVETVKESLKRIVLGKKISKVEVFYEPIIKNCSIEEFKDFLINETINDIKRVGKYLVFVLDNYIMLSHLRMEGKYNYLGNEKINIHEHVIFYLDDGHTLRYNDTRKFGTMHLFKTTDISSLLKVDPLNKLGIEPLDNTLTKEYLKNKISKLNKPLKTILLDQSIISGLGNIYADEVCYYSGLNPYVKGKDLEDRDYEKLIESMKIVITKAIELGGSTIKSFTSSHMITGRFQNELCVHLQTRCKCGSRVEKVFIGGRGTYFCNNCQKMK